MAETDRLLVKIDGDFQGLRGALSGAQAEVKRAAANINTSLISGMSAAGQARVAFVDYNRALTDGMAASGRAAQAGQVLSASLGTGAMRARNMGMVVQNAGYQVGDFAVQLASGGNAMRAMTQQLPQLLGGFGGPWMAVIGAAVAILGALLMNMDKFGLAAKTAADANSDFKTAMDAANAVLLTSDERTKQAAEANVFLARSAIAAATATNQLAIAELQRMENEQRARARAPRGTGQGERPMDFDFAAQIKMIENRQKVLDETLAKINDPTQHGATREAAAKAAEKVKLLDAEDAAVLRLIDSQQQALMLAQMGERERAGEEAAIQAAAAAMRDYNDGLRDSMFLSEVELAGIRARAVALYDLQQAQRQVAADQRKAEQAARQERQEVERLTRGFADLSREAIDAGDSIEAWADILLNNLDNIADAIIKMFDVNTGGEDGLGGLLGSLFSALAGSFGGPAGATAGSALGQGIGGSGLISIGGIRDGGGPVRAGVPYMIGPRQMRELFVPGESGAVLNAAQMRSRGGAGAPVFNINMPGATLEAVLRVEQMVRSLNGSIERRAVGAVYNESLRGGPLAMARR